MLCALPAAKNILESHSVSFTGLETLAYLRAHAYKRTRITVCVLPYTRVLYIRKPAGFSSKHKNFSSIWGGRNICAKAKTWSFFCVTGGGLEKKQGFSFLLEPLIYQKHVFCLFGPGQKWSRAEEKHASLFPSVCIHVKTQRNACARAPRSNRRGASFVFLSQVSFIRERAQLSAIIRFFTLYFHISKVETIKEKACERGYMLLTWNVWNYWFHLWRGLLRRMPVRCRSVQAHTWNTPLFAPKNDTLHQSTF